MFTEIQRIPTRLRPVKLLILILFFAGGFFVGGLRAHAQAQTIVGTIQDGETAEPLAGAHVFLASRLQGTTTDANGQFVIENVLPGSYKVVASIIGYDSESIILEIVEDQKPGNVAIRLKPIVYELDGVVVEESQPVEWQKQLELFNELFLGTSTNAKESTITNDYVLSFRESEDAFEAFASEPLEIENNGLGYHVTFVLKEFKHDIENGLKYTVGTWYFDELEPKNEKQAKQWSEQRELVFKGSLQHLLWSMIHLRTEEEGFHLLRDKSSQAEHPETFLTKYHPLDERTILRKSQKPYEYKMAFRDFIRVYFERRGDRVRLFGKKGPPAEQLSYVQMNRRGEATVHESGYLYAPAGSASSLTVYGYLASRGVADLLPQEYALQRSVE